MPKTKWTRSISTSMGVEEEDFVKAFMATLSNEYVLKKIKAALFDDFTKEIVQLRKALEVRDSRIKTLEAEVEKLSAAADNQEQYSRRNSLRISGLPESDTEDVVEESLKLFNNIMKVSPPIDLSEVDRGHRTGPKTGGRPRQILLKFATYRSRQRVYRERAVLNPGRRSARPWALGEALGETAPARSTDASEEPVMPTVYINEDLTKMRANLLYKARCAKKDKGILGCWSSDGQVLILTMEKKVIPINSETELGQHSRVIRNL